MTAALERFLAGYDWRRDIPRALAVLGPVAVGLAIVFVLADLTDIPQSRLSRDPVAVTGEPWYIGSLSTVGAMAWAAGSLVALVVGASTSSPERPLLVQLGLLGLWLSLDDALLIHEIARNSGEKYELDDLIYGAYMVVLALILLRHRRHLLGAGALLFACGLACSAASVASDILGGPNYLEDCFKFLGIAGWSGGLLFRSWEVLRRGRPTAGHEPPGPRRRTGR